MTWLRRGLRGASLAAAGVAAACGGTAPAPGGGPAGDPLAYLDSASYRRAELVASLVDPSNGYSSLRLTYYESGGAADWSNLPEWNPAVEPVADAELDAPGGAPTTTLSPAAAPLALPARVSGLDDPALLALGRAAFTRYPTQLAPYAGAMLASRAAAATYGLWTDAALGAGGLVRARMGDGSIAVAVTCATCHAARDASGAIEPGLPNAALDVGAAVLATPGSVPSSSEAQAVAAWGPGRLDVTTQTGLEPARLSDLRPVAWLGYLQQDATVRARDLTALAIRIETLVITSNDQVVRPPRMVALALAAYVASLGAGLPPTTAAAGASPRGATLFASECAGCHAGPGLTGDPVPLAVVGTDPTLGLSPSRGTGAYRVPSLRGAGSRGPLLHDGTVPSVAALLDPARPTPAFASRLHGAGAVPGHLYGLSLDDADRAALVAYVNAL